MTIEQQLARWKDRRARNRREARELSVELDRLVADALDAGLSVPQIARATGLSKQALYQRLGGG